MPFEPPEPESPAAQPSAPTARELFDQLVAEVEGGQLAANHPDPAPAPAPDPAAQSAPPVPPLQPVQPVRPGGGLPIIDLTAAPKSAPTSAPIVPEPAPITPEPAPVVPEPGPIAPEPAPVTPEPETVVISALDPIESELVPSEPNKSEKLGQEATTEATTEAPTEEIAPHPADAVTESFTALDEGPQDQALQVQAPEEQAPEAQVQQDQGQTGDSEIPSHAPSHAKSGGAAAAKPDKRTKKTKAPKAPKPAKSGGKEGEAAAEGADAAPGTGAGEITPQAAITYASYRKSPAVRLVHWARLIALVFFVLWTLYVVLDAWNITSDGGTGKNRWYLDSPWDQVLPALAVIAAVLLVLSFILDLVRLIGGMGRTTGSSVRSFVLSVVAVLIAALIVVAAGPSTTSQQARCTGRESFSGRQAAACMIAGPVLHATVSWPAMIHAPFESGWAVNNVE